MLHTRITVPLSDAVASIVPVELMERKEMGDLCACMTFATVNVRVEKRMTSPDCWVVGGGCVADDGCDKGDVGEGTGDGYARYDESADGESAQTARHQVIEFRTRRTRL